MAQKVGIVNPRTPPDPRFDPADNEDNAMAHKMDLMGADVVEIALPDSGEGDVEQGEADEPELQEIVTRMLEQAVSHYESNLEPVQKEATDYYWARPFGDEEEGRSKVVSSDVRDATQFQVPSLLDVFCGQEKVVEFKPRGPEDEPVAKQMSDYINYIVMEDNPGFITLDAAFKDALIRRLGAVKWWWDTFYRVEGETRESLTQDQLGMLVSDKEVTIDESSIALNDDGTFNLKLTRKRKDGCARIAAIPPEELVYTPDARTIDEAPIFAHIRNVPIEQVVAMVGEEHREFVESQVEKRKVSSSSLATARRYDESSDPDNSDTRPESQKLVVFAEAYTLYDGDGDGTAELRKCLCVGNKYKILNGDGKGEIVDETPFALFTPEPEPHAIVGMSNYDLLKDVQRIKSHALRKGMDSLSLSVEPKTEVVNGEVNMADLLNSEMGGIVRVRRPGMMREVKHTSAMPDVMPLVEYMDSVKEDRTGTSRAAMGLDADALQSSTKAAVAGTLSAAQRRTRYIARVFAETGMKRLFKGLLRLVIRHQNRSRVVRLNGQHVEVDPKDWDADYDVSISVGSDELKAEKREALETIYAAQKEQYLAGSPLISLVEIRNTMARYIELLGEKNVNAFIKPWGAAEQQQFEQAQAAQPPQQDPNMALVQVEQQKAQTEAQSKMLEFELKRWQAEQNVDIERDRLARDTALREKELELKYGAQHIEATMNAAIEHDRMQQEMEIQRTQADNPPQEAA